jgi:hypothetical protein
LRQRSPRTPFARHIPRDLTRHHARRRRRSPPRCNPAVATWFRHRSSRPSLHRRKPQRAAWRALRDATARIAGSRDAKLKGWIEQLWYRRSRVDAIGGVLNYAAAPSSVRAWPPPVFPRQFALAANCARREPWRRQHQRRLWAVGAAPLEISSVRHRAGHMREADDGMRTSNREDEVRRPIGVISPAHVTLMSGRQPDAKS